MSCFLACSIVSAWGDEMAGEGSVIVSEALANKCGNGGAAWVPLSWVRGLRQLGFDVWFVEELRVQRPAGHSSPVHAPSDDPVAYFCAVADTFGLFPQAALIADGEVLVGPPIDVLREVAAASVLVNIGGHLADGRLWPLFRCRVMLDLDPGFSQIWHAKGEPGDRVGAHDLHFTVGENIGKPGCAIPTWGVHWQPVRQPVVMEDWPVVQTPDSGRFTTVANWRGPFGPVEFGGATYGLKAHQFRKFFDLPKLSSHGYEIALSIYAEDEPDRRALVEHGWRLAEPGVVGTPETFRAYVQGSGAEFSVAQGVYVDTGSGWFSDRTVRYLASGRPALVQDTGFSQNIPVGEGLLAFRNLEEAATAADRIVTDYASHAASARALAEAYFSAERVLIPFCEQLPL
jgi:hypothetical protein